MALKIKWNDDRVRATAAALLLLSRARLIQKQTADLIAAALADYRADPEGFKAEYPKRDLKAAKDQGGLKHPQHVEYYRKLVAEVERQLAKFEKNKRQFTSLAELDNFWVLTLKSYD